MIYPRITEQIIEKYLPGKEIIILYGPRRAGKTTLLKHLEEKLTHQGHKTAYFSLDDPGAQAVFSEFSADKLHVVFSGLGFGTGARSYLFLDEIISFSSIDRLLKIISDHFPDIKIFATSSSSILLADTLTESLAGRKYFVEMLPLTLAEINGRMIENYFDFSDFPLEKETFCAQLADIAVFGSYPEVVNLKSHEEKRGKLRDIIDSALFKDIFLYEGIKHPQLLTKLLSLLSYQTGSLVNLNELSVTLGTSRHLVEEYLGLLEKFFVVFRLRPFEHNLRSEITFKFKVYFWDTGIRNAIISRFEHWDLREDKGAILENLVIAGLQKRNLYSSRPYQTYFWRNYDGFEVDLITQGVEHPEILAVEIKYSGKGKISHAFLNAYKPKKTMVVGRNDAYKFFL
ncbi:ATP-binding protein [Candidatus Gottesmanbacteria bacterium]|nr:ATP-binding protein [Candidatus Gottesmanbacteria bacterium]